MAPHMHEVTKTRTMPTDRLSEAINQFSIIINTLTEEISRSQEVLLGRITQLDEKCDAVHEQQAALRWTIETQIVPYMSTMSQLLVDVCEQLATSKVIKLTEQQQTKIHRLPYPPTTSRESLSPSLFSRGFSSAHPRSAHQYSTPSEVNCIYSSHSGSLSFQWI